MAAVATTAVWRQMEGFGDGVGARFDRLQAGRVPEATALRDGGEDAAREILAALAGSPSLALDGAWVIYAWALGESGLTDALSPLSSGLERAFDAGLPPAGRDRHLPRWDVRRGGR